MSEFKNVNECKDYLRSNNLKKGIFFVNVYGWDKFFTLEPTFCTPTGLDKNFPRKVEIGVRTERPRVIYN